MTKMFMCIKWLLPSQVFQLKTTFITIEYVTIAMYKGKWIPNSIALNFGLAIIESSIYK